MSWQYGMPPKGNANYGWVQQLMLKLKEQFGESARLERAIRENLRGLGL